MLTQATPVEQEIREQYSGDTKQVASLQTGITKTIDDKSVEEIENMFKRHNNDQGSTVIDLHLNDPARIFEHDDCKGHSVTLPVPWTLAENTGGWTLRSTLEAWNYDDL